MLAACLVATFFLEFAPDAREIGQSALSSALFYSNIRFFSLSGYFDQSAETNPLIHTWSLSVEEQFYIVFPILILALARLRRRWWSIVVAAIAGASLAAASWQVFRDPPAAFFLTQYRIWELLAGSLLVIGPLPLFRDRRLAEAAGLAGLALILASLILISDQTPFPGLAALPPCLGAALLLHSGASADTIVARLLSVGPLRFIGLISYSLYLWHWPILVFYRELYPLDAAGTAIVLATSFALATLSWRYVETPFRRLRHVASFKVIGTGLATMAVTVVAALWVAPAIGRFWPIPESVEKLLAYAEVERDAPNRMGRCFMTSLTEGQAFDAAECLKVRPGVTNLLLLGDSHAAHLWAGLTATVDSVNWLQANATGCKPVVGRGGEARCRRVMDYIFGDFIPRREIQGIVISARWNSADLPKLLETVDYLHRFVPTIIVSGPIVEYDRPLPRLLARSLLNGGDPVIDSHRSREQPLTDGAMAAALANGPAHYVSMYHTVCDPDCEVWAAPGVPLQFDYGHLTVAGSMKIAKLLWPQIAGASGLAVALHDPAR